MIGEYILLVVLLLAAIFIVVAVTLKKSDEEGLSGTISGGSETYFGNDKNAGAGKLLNKWMLIVSCVFAVAVLVAYIMQPDYGQTVKPETWQTISEFSSIFK